MIIRVRSYFIFIHGIPTYSSKSSRIYYRGMVMTLIKFSKLLFAFRILRHFLIQRRFSRRVTHILTVALYFLKIHIECKLRGIICSGDTRKQGYFVDVQYLMVRGNELHVDVSFVYVERLERFDKFFCFHDKTISNRSIESELITLSNRLY